MIKLSESGSILPRICLQASVFRLATGAESEYSKMWFRTWFSLNVLARGKCNNLWSVQKMFSSPICYSEEVFLYSYC